MKTISLQSGSNGNCFYVETEKIRLLIDAGISGKAAQQRLAEHGRDIRDVDALFVTHDHSDHSRCIGVFQRKFGMPIYTTQKTLAAIQQSGKVGTLSEVRFFEAGDVCALGDVHVHSIPTPHDSADGVAFVVDDGRSRVGILTDLGHVFDGLKEVLQTLDGVVLESNYDEQMLESGPYPHHLKRRIRGIGGHISNREAAKLLNECCAKRLRWACLCHLSHENNSPEIALRTHQAALQKSIELYVARRDACSAVMEL
ncbi:MAG: MBL fold metallo-hydrolase [Proteobacteria bacterium]|nr:MBL fold metallo-hydrolase [Pseudomonadota bacterium]